MADSTAPDAGGLARKQWAGTMPRDATRAVPAPPTSVNEAVSAPDRALDKRAARILRSQLQKALGREVSVRGEGARTKVTRVATNPYVVLGAATIGVGVAGVLTAGIAHVVIGAVGAAN
jgi:hypothetical protein